MRILKARCWYMFTNARVLIIFRKVNGIVKVNTNPLKNTSEFDHYW